MRILIASSSRSPWFESQDPDEHMKFAPYSVDAIGATIMHQETMGFGFQIFVLTAAHEWMVIVMTNFLLAVIILILLRIMAKMG